MFLHLGNASLPIEATCVQCSATVTRKIVVLAVQRESPVIQHVSILILILCLCFCHWAPVKTSWLCPLYGLSQVFIHIDEISLNFPFFGLRNPNTLRLSSRDKYSSPTIVFVALCWMLSTLTSNEQPRTEHSTPGGVLPVLRGRTLSLHLLAMPCLMQLRRPSRRPTAAFAAWAVSCLGHSNPQDPQVLFCQDHF